MDVLDIKRIADKTVGNFNKASKDLLNVFDPQNKNLFEVLLYPSDISFSSPSTIALAGLDILLTRIYIQSIDVPFLNLDYQDYQEVKEVKDIIYPDSISITFIENELGFVRTYIAKWIETIIEPVKGAKNYENSYYFSPNQQGAKKNGVIVPFTGLGLPSFPVIKFWGLKPKSIENIIFSQGDGDPMLIVVSFNVDNTWLNPLI